MRDPIFYRRFDYDRRLLPNAYLQELENGVTDIDAARKISGGTIGYPGWGLLYYVLMSHLAWDRPNMVLETGTNRGLSTIVLAQAIKDARVEGHIHTIEIDPETASMARNNIDKAGVGSHVTLHIGDAKSLLPHILEGVSSLRIAFLDGSHKHDDVVAEFEMVLNKLEPTGIVIFDNTYPLTDPSLGEPARVHEALKTIRKRHGGNIINFEYVSWYTPGVAIWQR